MAADGDDPDNALHEAIAAWTHVAKSLWKPGVKDDASALAAALAPGVVDVDVSLLGYQETALHLACKGGKLSCVQWLAETAKANLEAKSAAGCTPLYWACHMGHLEIVKYLIGRGANVEATDIFGQRPVHGATLKGSTEILQVLRDAGANVTVATTDTIGGFAAGTTPLDMARKLGKQHVIDALSAAK